MTDEIPPPAIRASELWGRNVPFPLLTASRQSIGWQQTPSSDATVPLGERVVFATLRRSALGTYKAINTYPLTKDGWVQACQELATLDPSTIPKLRKVLAQRIDEDAARAAEVPTDPVTGSVIPPSEPEPPQPWEPMTAAERRVMTPEQKRARRQQWQAMTLTERREAIDASAEHDRQERVASGKGERWITRRVSNPVYAGLGVRVRDGQVYKYPTFSQPALGPLAGARAEITDPTKAQMIRAGVVSGITLGALIGPLALAPGVLRKSKAVAFVIFPNGKLHEKNLDGTAAIRAAQRDAMRFNTLAGSVETPAPAAAQPPPPTASERLAEVTRLHDAGLLTDEEYQVKRAEIISQL